MTFLIAAGLLAQPALAFDHTHAAFTEVLAGAVSDEGVDYDVIASRKEALEGYLSEVANANVRSFSQDQKIAFYVNAYNALTVNLIVTKDKPASIRDLSGGKVWDVLSFPVGRENLTLNQIEHGKVRKMTDGRVHAVINCASKGCPPLPPKALSAVGIDAQLNEGARRWVRTNAYRYDNGVLELSKVFNWYAEDFTGMEKGTASEAEMFKGGRAFITAHGATFEEPKSVVWATYDWSLNAR